MADGDGDRPHPPRVGDERALLDGWLNFHRATLLWKCEGLTIEQLCQPAVPTSALTLLGLVRHLTEVEREWLLPLVGEPDTDLYSTRDHPNGAFDVAEADLEGDLGRYGETVDALSDLLADHSLDQVHEAGEDSYSLRWALIHLIEEYARHNGHADLLREAVDGSTGA